MSESKKPVPIVNAIALKNYLRQKGENHIKYNHFTTSKSLNSIIQTKTLRLTLGNSKMLNDHHEFGAKGKKDVWDRTYIFCFSYNNNENMALLGLYGLPSEETVRFTLEKESIKKIINKDKIKIYTDLNTQQELDKNLIEEIFFADIFYVKDKYEKMPKHGDDELVFQNNNIYSVFSEPESTGIVKNDVWSQEKEVRLILKFSKKQEDEKGKIFEHIYLKFPEEILEEIQITKGPNFKENYVNRQYYSDLINQTKFDEEKNNKKLFENIDNINEKIKEKNEVNKKQKKTINLIELKESIFKGKIHFKSDNFVQVKKEVNL